MFYGRMRDWSIVLVIPIEVMLMNQLVVTSADSRIAHEGQKDSSKPGAQPWVKVRLRSARKRPRDWSPRVVISNVFLAGV